MHREPELSGSLRERFRWLVSHAGYRAYVLRKLLGKCGVDLDAVLKATGYRFEFLDRVVLYRVWDEFLRLRDLSVLDTLEISPGENSRWHRKEFKSYTSVQFPSFDLCQQTLDRVFDVVIIDNVLEHVPDPRAAVGNAFAMLRAGGHLMV